MHELLVFEGHTQVVHALYYKYVSMIICIYTYITFIIFLPENSLLANVYFTFYPTLNKLYFTLLYFTLFYFTLLYFTLLSG